MSLCFVSDKEEIWWMEKERAFLLPFSYKIHQPIQFHCDYVKFRRLLVDIALSSYSRHLKFDFLSLGAWFCCKVNQLCNCKCLSPLVLRHGWMFKWFSYHPAISVHLKSLHMVRCLSIQMYVFSPSYNNLIKEARSEFKKLLSDCLV